MVCKELPFAIREFIQQWIMRNAIQPPLSQAELLDQNLFAQGYIDSLAMFRLILELEVNFKKPIDQAHFFSEAQPTISSMSLVLAEQWSGKRC